MSIITGVIKTLTSKFGTTLPVTVTKAVYDETTGEKLDATIGGIKGSIGDTSTLPTESKEAVGAITELFNGVTYNHNFLSGMEFGYDGANAFFIDFKVKTGNIARLIIRDTGLTYAYFNNGEWLTVWTK
ncbi:hypothetical protein [Qiania dongpingensis]|uniref:Uncharacterized protein n=1 Tax=Qiania dongpingensis TaxID=2763669 RepID=A0A7G9G6Y1_9FIRM|nr:hypothetical protein [Qiania dongpingensis]QNM06563.1 hypothetical protein H9Q78_05370 [Qiania dongpingensis]